MAGTINPFNNQIAGSYNQIILNAGTNGVAISTDASAATVNVATGGAVKTTTLGSTNSTSATTVQSGSGALNVTATGGALTINSGTGALSISSDASATTVNIATGGAAKIATLGSTNGASSLALKYGTADFTLASATGTVMSALDTGEITYPLQSAFLATVTIQIDNVTGDGTVYTIAYNTEVFDQNSDFSSTTFTAPVTGRYHFDYSNEILGIVAGHSGSFLRITTSNRAYLSSQFNPFAVSNGGTLSNSISIFADMDAADTAITEVDVAGGAKVVDVGASGGSWFAGSLVC